MNRLLTFAGQQPIYLGDFDFIQDAAKNMLACIARGLMNQESDTLNAILQGVNIQYVYSGQQYEWDAGVVVLNGEILPVRSGSVSGRIGTPLYFHVLEETSGERTFKDGTTRNCWASRYAVINTNRTGGVSVSSVDRLHKSEEEDEPTTDDVVYTGSTTSQSIAAAKLIKKSGIWFCDVAFAVSEGSYGSFGDVQFSGLTSAHIAELQTKTFTFFIPLSTAVWNSETEAWGPSSWQAQPIRITFSGEISTGVLNMSFAPFNTTVKLSGSANLQQVLVVY